MNTHIATFQGYAFFSRTKTTSGGFSKSSSNDSISKGDLHTEQCLLLPASKNLVKHSAWTGIAHSQGERSCPHGSMHT